MEGRSQWRAMTACRHIAPAEISNSRYARCFSNAIWVTYLHSERCSSCAGRTVSYCLAVAAYSRYILPGDAEYFQITVYTLANKFSQQAIAFAKLV